jgi:hypothetical protein
MTTGSFRPSTAHLAAAALALACALPAQALRRSHDGAGQAVLVPYYTVRDDRTTLLSIVNHAEQPKAVRFVLAEGRNGRPALIFNIYLARRDTWTGALVADPLGARLLSSDETCTVPAIPAGGVALRDFQYRGSNDDGLGTDPARLQQGQFEAIEMGELSGEAALLAARGQCDSLVQRFVDAGVWTTAPNTDLLPPSGQLSVSAQIVDVGAGGAWDVPSVSFEEFSLGGARHANLVDAGALRITRPTLGPGETRFVVEGNAEIPGDRAADAVSLALMATTLEAAFLLEPSLGAGTEWVVSLPTRHSYLDDRPGGVLPPGAAPLAPFGSGSAIGNAPRCNPVTYLVFRRDGAHIGFGSPPGMSPGELCAQVTHFQVDPAEHILQPPSSGRLYTEGVLSGRLRLELRPDLHELHYTVGTTGQFGGELHGLPALVVPLIEARNAAAQPGRLATYGFSGQVVRRVTGAVDFGAAP